MSKKKSPEAKRAKQQRYRKRKQTEARDDKLFNVLMQMHDVLSTDDYEFVVNGYIKRGYIWRRNTGTTQEAAEVKFGILYELVELEDYSAEQGDA